jgi:hypothetical protein
MNKKLLTATFAAILLVAGFTASHAQTTVEVDPSKTWIGYMNVFNNNAGAQGTYVFGSGWGVADLKSTFGPQTLTLQPNFNTYVNAVNNTDPVTGPQDRAFWTDSTDGGVTAGLNGNKWMEASTFTESYDASLKTNLTFSGAIQAFTLLNPNYSATAFIKVLEPFGGWNTIVNQTTALTSTGDFSVSADLSTVDSGYLVQYGFAVNGLNANPANEAAFGSVVVEAVPEPSTYAMLAVGAAGLGAHMIRRRRR